MLGKILSKVFNYDPRYRTRTTRRVVERRVPRYESPRQIQQGTPREWAEESCPELDDASYAQRLEEEERYQRSRATRLSEQHEGMGREHKEISIIPDPWIDHESRTTPGSLEERW